MNSYKFQDEPFYFRADLMNDFADMVVNSGALALDLGQVYFRMKLPFFYIYS